MGKNNYYLQSIDYLGNELGYVDEGTIRYYLYTDRSGAIIAMSKAGVIKSTFNSAGHISLGGVITFSSRQENSYDDNGKPTTITISAERVKNEYISTLTPYLTQGVGKGLKIDLKAG
jgi:hypothetical protein